MQKKSRRLLLPLSPLLLLLLLTTSQITPKSITPNPELYLNSNNYKIQAQTWVKTYILNNNKNKNLLIYPQELQLIANLIYFSFMRSYYTLHAQDKALEMIDLLWKGWKNIAQTRLDPSQESPYNIQDYEKHNSLATFWNLHDMHQKMGKTYTQAVNNILNGDLLQTIQAKNSVQNMRNQARTVVAQSIVNIKNYMGQFFYTPKSNLNKKTKSITSFINYMYQYIPQLAISSFVQANKTNDIASDKTWNILMKIQQVGKQTWQTIELERAAFYLAFYQEIWHAIKISNLEPDYYEIVFDEHGILNPEEQKEHIKYLPEPDNFVF